MKIVNRILKILRLKKEPVPVKQSRQSMVNQWKDDILLKHHGEMGLFIGRKLDGR